MRSVRTQQVLLFSNPLTFFHLLCAVAFDITLHKQLSLCLSEVTGAQQHLGARELRRLCHVFPVPAPVSSSFTNSLFLFHPITTYHVPRQPIHFKLTDFKSDLSVPTYSCLLGPAKILSLPSPHRQLSCE